MPARPCHACACWQTGCNCSSPMPLAAAHAACVTSVHLRACRDAVTRLQRATAAAAAALGDHVRCSLEHASSQRSPRPHACERLSRHSGDRPARDGGALNTGPLRCKSQHRRQGCSRSPLAAPLLASPTHLGRQRRRSSRSCAALPASKSPLRQRGLDGMAGEDKDTGATRARTARTQRRAHAAEARVRCLSVSAAMPMAHTRSSLLRVRSAHHRRRRDWARDSQIAAGW